MQSNTLPSQEEDPCQKSNTRDDIGNDTGTNKSDHRADTDILMQARAGFSISSTMIPDPAIPRNAPEHIESYQEPHIIAFNTYGWTITRTTNIGLRPSNISEQKQNGQAYIIPPHNYIYPLGGKLSYFLSYCPARNEHLSAISALNGM